MFIELYFFCVEKLMTLFRFAPIYSYTRCSSFCSTLILLSIFDFDEIIFFF